MAKRSLGADAPRTPSFPALGEDTSTWLAEHSLSLRYGTSLRLMASCSAFLNASEEFAEIDPNADWEKWQLRVPNAFSLFYAAILDPMKPEGGAGVLCVLRAVLDGWPSPAPPHNARLIIDYTTTHPEHRGKGFASKLVEHVRQACASIAANCYVLALEDSCVYWMEKGFVLEANPNLNARLNMFPDTHLLRLASDPSDEVSPDDLALAEEEEEEGEEEAGEAAAAAQAGGASPSPVAAGASAADADEEADLQAALALSMAPTASASPTGEEEHGEQGGAAPSAELAPPRPQPRTPPVELEGGGGEDEDDAEMQAALALSLS